MRSAKRLPKVPLMKLVRWRRFTWELSKLPALEKPLPDHYHVRSALRDEEKVVANVSGSIKAGKSKLADLYYFEVRHLLFKVL